MRKIKFRAWYKYGKKMVDLYKITPLAVADHNGTMDGLFLPFDNNMILMQYTGLLDKNGKEIYEGDVVKEGGLVSVIEWANERYCYRTTTGTIGLYGFCGEIIGNIYENPELIS